MRDEQIKTDLKVIIGAERVPAGETMADVLARLDRLAEDGNLPERLEHYLSRRSYVKALEWLDNPDTPHRV